MGEMSPDLRSAYASHADTPDHHERVIVTLEPGATLDALDGFDVHRTARSGTIVMGTATLAAATAIADSDTVVRIERDGEMEALD
jgi:hypothetical protein